MAILENFRELSRQLHKTIVLPEGGDDRTIEAAARIINEKISKLIILGDADKINAQLAGKGINHGFTAISPENDPRLHVFSEKYYEKRKSKGITREEATEAMKNELFFGAMLVQTGEADGCLAGAANTTSDVLRAGLRVVGVADGVKTVSSCFIMATSKKELGANGLFLFADSAVNPDPDAQMLADIALSTAQNCRKFLHVEPRVAMLSFSTMGSGGNNPSIKKMAEAVQIVKERAPDLMVDGEMQLDAAVIPEIGNRKAPESPVAGKANVLIFPNLDAANIGYKLVERFSDAQAIGPIVQGFAKPVNDLSRGASVMDIVNMVAVTAVQSG